MPANAKNILMANRNAVALRMSPGVAAQDSNRVPLRAVTQIPKSTPKIEHLCYNIITKNIENPNRAPPFITAGYPSSFILPIAAGQHINNRGPRHYIRLCHHRVPRTDEKTPEIGTFRYLWVPPGTHSPLDLSGFGLLPFPRRR